AGIISGTGTLSKSGAGTLVLSGAANNTYSGATTVNQGMLLLSKTSSNAVPGALIVGDGSGGANADVVQFTGNLQIASSSAVTINISGRLDLNGFTGSVGSLSM